MITRHFGRHSLGGSLRRLLAGLRYGAELLGLEPAPALAGVAVADKWPAGPLVRQAWGGLVAWGRSMLGLSHRRHRGHNSMYMEYLEQRQLMSAFQLAGSRDAANVHLYHLALTTDSASMQSWTVQWNDGSQPQTFAGDAPTADHTFTSLTDPTITATAVDDDGVHALALVPPTPNLASTSTASQQYNFVFAPTADGVVSLQHTNASDPTLIGTVMAWTQAEENDPAVAGTGRLAVQATVPAQGALELLLTPVAQLQRAANNALDGSGAAGTHGTQLNRTTMDTSSAETGYVTRGIWDVPGYEVANLTGYGANNETPDETSQLNSLTFVDEYPETQNGSRVQGYIIAPEDGDYTFWLAAHDSADLYLSTSSDVASASLIASVQRDESKDGNQGQTNFDSASCSYGEQGGLIHLTQGEEYYFEVLQKTGDWAYGSMAVGWSDDVNGGNGTIDRQVIGGDCLSPYLGPAGDVPVDDPGFEVDYGLGDDHYQYDPPASSWGSAWTYSGDAGLVSDESTWGVGSVHEGHQVAFLDAQQGYGWIAQQVDFPTGGTYSIRLLGAQQVSGGTLGIACSVDNTSIGTLTPNTTYIDTNFAPYWTEAFSESAGTHTIRFSIASTGTGSVYLDFVSIVNLGSWDVPEPRNFTATADGCDATTLSWRGNSYSPYEYLLDRYSANNTFLTLQRTFHFRV